MWQDYPEHYPPPPKKKKRKESEFREVASQRLLYLKLISDFAVSGF